MTLFLTLFAALYGSCAVFIVSELGERVSDAHNEVFSRMEQLNWYSMPLEMQRLLPTIICVTQHPVLLKCFGSISLSRELFKKVNQN